MYTKHIMKLEYKIKDNKYTNIKQILKEEFHISDRLIIKLKKNNHIYINNNSVPISEDFKVNDLLTIDLDFTEESENIISTKMNLDILYEDDGLLIINKSSNIPVHPSMMHFENSLSNGVKYYFETNNIKRKIRPVNRLDKNTSGIVIFAKNEYIQECLSKQMQLGLFNKEYIAILEGNLENNSGTINAPISRKENSIIERKVSEKGATSITHYELIKNYNDYCLVKFILETGRTHQIRVHSKYIGHPILGDTLYGNLSNLIGRQALHAYKVEFIHPITSKTIEIISNLPYDIKNLIN